MIKKITYVAEDGKEFANETECVQYEKAIQLLPELKSAIKVIGKFCSNYIECFDCPFYTENYNCCFKDFYPEDWKEIIKEWE